MPMYDAPNHTQIPNKFLDDRMLHMSGSAVKVFLAIARKTFGWHKESLRDRISFSQLRKISGVSSNETLYRCFEELKDDIEKEVINGVTYFSISATASMQQYFGGVTVSVTPRDDNRHSTVTETVNTKERVKETHKDTASRSEQKALIGEFCTLFTEKTGQKAVVVSADWIQSARLLKALGLDTCTRALKAYFGKDTWFNKDSKSFGNFVRHINDVLSSLPKEKKPPKQFDMEHYEATGELKEKTERKEGKANG